MTARILVNGTRRISTIGIGVVRGCFGLVSATELISLEKVLFLGKLKFASTGNMDNHFIRVTRAQDFMQLLERSLERPVVIFKHSTTCVISASAYDEMQKFEGEVVLVEVQRARELSREIEKQTGVRHESPQVLILEKGTVVWNASHRKVKALAVAEAISGIGKQR
jgi:bacillithiol system protein YtxJ